MAISNQLVQNQNGGARTLSAYLTGEKVQKSLVSTLGSEKEMQKFVSSIVAAASANAIVAPMPGTINAVKVTSGQQVKKGDVLVILEAMKMENEIYADKDGKVGQVFVQKGASVQTGTALVEIL